MDKKIKPVVTSGVKVATKKQSAFGKIIESFAPDDVQDLKSYIWNSIIVPGVKNSFYNAVGAFLGINKPPSGYSGYSSGYGYNYPYTYGSYTSYSYSQPHAQPKKNDVTTYRTREILFDTKSDAIRVLKEMVEIINGYTYISVADFCELCNVRATTADVNYGWCDLSDATIVQVNGRWKIQLPRPIVLM